MKSTKILLFVLLSSLIMSLAFTVQTNSWHFGNIVITDTLSGALKTRHPISDTSQIGNMRLESSGADGKFRTILGTGASMKFYSNNTETMRLNDAEGITASKWLTINDAGGSAPIPSDGASVRIFMKSGKLIFLYASSEESPQYWFFNLSGSSDQYLIYNGNTEP